MTEPRTQSGRALVEATYVPIKQRMVTVENEARAALLDELEAAVKGYVQHEESIAARTDIYREIVDDAEGRVTAYRLVLALIQQHRETT